MKRLLLVISLFASAAVVFGQSPQWTPSASQDWYSRQPWMFGANYIQSNTVNQIEMWQQETFDGDRIDLELGWAETLGVNTLRVFLQEVLWQKDQSGFQKRIDKLLKLADKHKMRVILVLFDSSGDPYPEFGHQHQPKPGVRNSLWVQSPGAKGLVDAKALDLALRYAKDVVSAFSIDKRVLAWDVWNEPENSNPGLFSASDVPKKAELMRTILPEAFRYARAGNPTQPVTSGLWQSGDWSSLSALSPMEKIQVELSDFVSFQNYAGPEDFEKRVKQLQAFGRPVLCTGFLSRSQGSTFEAILPLAIKYNVGALMGDLVAGKTQKWLPADSWQNPYVGDRKPAIWSQDVFLSTGPAYKEAEVEFIRKTVAAGTKPTSGKTSAKKSK